MVVDGVGRRTNPPTRLMVSRLTAAPLDPRPSNWRSRSPCASISITSPRSSPAKRTQASAISRSRVKVRGRSRCYAWAAWLVGTRFAVTSHLHPVDVAFVRYLVSALLLAPVLFRNGLGFRQLGVLRTALLVGGAGLPFLLVASSGMKFAAASDAGAVMMGTMPVFVALFSALSRRRTASTRCELSSASSAGKAGRNLHRRHCGATACSTCSRARGSGHHPAFNSPPRCLRSTR